MPHRRSAPLLALMILIAAAGSAAADLAPDVDSPEPEGTADERVVSYELEFFSVYQPITARDLVERVPGFQIRDGGGERGFGGTPGNVLINGTRPSAKDESAADILDRIPASRVERVDLIRGQGGGLDLRGQSVAVNVILRPDAPAAVQWSATVEQDLDSGGPTPTGEISITDQLGKTRYTAGLRIGRFFFGNPAFERLFSREQPVEDRFEQERTKGHNAAVNLNTETVLDRWRIQSNLRLNYQSSQFQERSRREPLDPAAPRRVRILSDRDEDFSVEAGGDAEYDWSDTFSTKGIALIRRSSNDSNAGDQLFLFPREFNAGSTAQSKTESGESILRLESNWSGLANHLLEFDAEVALNTLDSELRLSVDEGDGPMPVPVPGANSRVEERRADVSIADSWQRAPWLLETALAAEASRISQSGPGGESREFFFLKPRLALTWAPSQSQQTRLAIERRIAQLNFGDFVSAVNFEDDDFDLGNPMLSPSSTWAVELTREQRFGEIGVVSVTAFGNWITDVQDLLPLGDRFEVPGNIGDGRRLGVSLEATLPLDVIGVRGGRLDIESRWQDSRVTDPVTGLNRSLSGERDLDIELEFRQDLSNPSLSWGWEIERSTERRDFGIDEIDRFENGVDVEVFIETSEWLGVKFSLTAQNLLNRKFERERLLFDGPRDSADLLFRENRDRRRERSLVFGVSGSF